MKRNTATHFSRRNFLRTSGAAFGAVGTASLLILPQSATSATVSRVNLAKRNVILFQGDSITDAGRSRKPEEMNTPNNQAGMGGGYAWLAAAALLVDHPKDELKVLNRGVSGNKVFELMARWEPDCLDLKPDVLSILIGVNDFWHTLDRGYKGTIEIYERDYHALIERTKRALPDVKILICEPFVLRCGAVKDTWFPEFDRYRAAARRVAGKHRAAFVPFQAMFDEALKYAPPQFWTRDGIHPSPAGAALMAHSWSRAVSGAA